MALGADIQAIGSLHPEGIHVLGILYSLVQIYAAKSCHIYPAFVFQDILKVD